MSPLIYKRFHSLAITATAITYFLIFLGGLVRVSGAGMGCPDWPKCYGLWIPPTEVSQLPAGYDPITFNATLTWIEYINRLFGVLTGFVILALAFYAVKHFRAFPKPVLLSLTTVVLVVFQGWVGKVVVNTDLAPFIVSIHLVVAIIIVTILLWVTLLSSSMRRAVSTDKSDNGSSVASDPKNQNIQRVLLALWGVSIIQFVLGTRIREALEHLAKKYPLLESKYLLELVGTIGHIHGVLGVTVFLLTLFLWMLHKQDRSGASHSYTYSKIALILIVVQLGIGMTLTFVGIPPVLQLFHQWVASGYLGVLFCLSFVHFSPLRSVGQRLSEKPSSEPRVAKA